MLCHACRSMLVECANRIELVAPDSSSSPRIPGRITMRHTSSAPTATTRKRIQAADRWQES
jgi:hypothetical protein